MYTLITIGKVEIFYLVSHIKKGVNLRWLSEEKEKEFSGENWQMKWKITA